VSVAIASFLERDEAAMTDDRRAVLLALIHEQLGDLAARPMLTVEEFAEWWGVGRSTGYQTVREGRIPSLRVGRRILIPTAALVALLLGVEQ
jgi:excisionase family DNA binding protein